MMTRKKIILGLAAVLMVFSAVTAAVGYSVWKRVNDAGGLKVILEQALSDDKAGISSSIESTEVAFNFSAAPFRLTAKNIRLTALDTSLTLPSSEFGFSIYNILTGNLVPSDMRMSGLEIEIAHGREGWHAGPSMALITSLMQGNVENAVDSQALASIRNIYIGNAQVTIRRDPAAIKDDRPDTIVLSPIGISMRYQEDRINGYISINNSLGGAVKVDFSGNNTGTEIKFSTALDNINMATIYPYLGLNVPEISQIGLIDGRVTMSVVDRKITALSGDLITGAGETDLPGLGGVAFSNASLLFAYDAVQDLLTISNFDMTTLTPAAVRPGKVNFTGQVRQPLSTSPLVIAKLRGSDLPFERLMSIWPENERNQLRTRVGETLRGGQVLSLGLDTVGSLDRDRNVFEITTFDLVSELRGIDLDTRFASVENLKGTLGARLELSIGSNGIIEHAAADLLLRNASLVTTSSEDRIDLEGIEFRTTLDGNVLTVTRGAIDARRLGQMAMVAKIALEPDWHPHRFDVSVKAEQIDKNLFVDLWPDNLRPKTRQWIENRIHGGQINGLTLNAGIDIPRGTPPEVIYLDGKARLVNSGLTYISGMPAITRVNAPLTFEGSFVRADLETGMLDGLDVAGSRIIIRKNEVGPMADVAVLANGDFGGALRLVNHPELDLLKEVGFPISGGTGDIDASMSMKWVIPGDNETIDDTGGMEVNLSASVIDAGLTDLPEGIVLTDANIDMMVAGGRVNIAGRGKLNEADTVMSLIYTPQRQLNVMLNLEKSEGMTTLMQRKSGLDLMGETGGTVQVSRQGPSRETAVKVDIDLTSTSINLDRFGLVKLPREPAHLKANFMLENGLLTKVSDISLESEFLSVDGHMSFDETGQFLGAYFGNVAWPGNDISQITMEFDENNVMNISADAHVIDLTPLRREESPGEGVSLVVDLTANRIVLDQNMSLSGNVGLTTAEDGTGEATFLGTLFFDGEPFMREGTMTAMFGGGQDLMEGRGLIGGAEASISLSPSEAGGNLLVLRSNNAGQVLKTLNIIDAIRGGKLYMVAEFFPEEDDRSMVNFELEDFRVIEAPTAIRMMSVLSLAGMYSLIEGDGTHFNLGHARVETRGSKQIIHSARSTGDALAVDLVGVIDTEAKELEVSGALLPIYGITKLLGNVPLVSEILTGIDNSGLLVTQFTIQGPLADPQGSINLSSIVPGVFRDVFSPNWISRERERLIGADNSTASPDQP